MCACGYAHHIQCVEVKGQLSGFDSLLPPCEFLRLDSGGGCREGGLVGLVPVLMAQSPSTPSWLPLFASCASYQLKSFISEF